MAHVTSAVPAPIRRWGQHVILAALWLLREFLDPEHDLVGGCAGNWVGCGILYGTGGFLRTVRCQVTRDGFGVGSPGTLD